MSRTALFFLIMLLSGFSVVFAASDTITPPGASDTLPPAIPAGFSPEQVQKYLEQQNKVPAREDLLKPPAATVGETNMKNPEIKPQPVPTPPPTDLSPSRLEKAFLKPNLTLLDPQKPEVLQRNLKQFGYDFFKNSGQLAQAIDTLPDSSEYILGPGDVVKLSIWGTVDLRYELTVDRNGELLIPRVGLVRVWGLGFDKARSAVKDAIGRLYRNFEINLTLEKLRSVQVYVVGEVEKPGRYQVSAQGTIINALAAAGGPATGGSLRQIRVTRGTQTVETLDLYDMLLTGDRGRDLRLQNGDTIFVPVIGPVVAVAGEVKRPAIYEMKDKTTLPQVLQMAGGIAASGSLGRIQVERLENNTSRVALDFVPKGDTPELSLGAVELKDRDMVKVFPLQAAMRQVVVLKGNVQQPGEYQFRPGMRLSDLIPSAQTLLPESYLDSVEIYRMAPPDYRRELLTVSLRRALAGNSTDNVALQEQDTVRVFSRWEMEEKPRVVVNGAVVNPGTYDYFPGMSVRDLVTAAGSPKRNAYLDQAELSRISISGNKAESSRIQLDLGKAMAGDPVHNLPLRSDDVLIVRGVTEWQDSTDKFVTLKGEVRFPGVYSLTRGEKLSSVLERAGGYTSKAYLSGAKLTRRAVREMQQKRMDEIAAKMERDIVQKQASVAAVAASKEELEATKAALDGLQKSLVHIKSLRAEGRIVIRLSGIEEYKKSDSDLVLEGGDELEVPLNPSVVMVLGQVYNPNSFIFQEGHDAGWYLNKTGGAVATADESEMYLIRADGTVYSRQQHPFFSSFLSTPLNAGDTLIVPEKIDRIAWVREIKDWTQILANVALTAGTIRLYTK